MKQVHRNRVAAVLLAVLAFVFVQISYGQTGVVGDPVLKTSDLIVYESGCANGLIATGSGGCSVDEIDVADGVGATSSNSGFEFGGTGGAQIGLLQGCAANEILKWNDGTSVWACSADSGGQALFFTSPATLTISTGSVALAGAANTITSYLIDTEAAASSDPLTAVTCTAGSWYLLAAANTTHTVVMTDGAGMLFQADFSLDNTEDTMFVECSATDTLREIARSNNGA